MQTESSRLRHLSGPPPARRRPPSDREILGWVAAGAIALVAVTGLAVVLAALMLALSFPAWIEVPVSIVLVGGACVYAWVVAKGFDDRTRGNK